MGQDSSYYLKFGFRFQTLYANQWNVANDDLGSLEDYNASLFIRRSRLKFDGWALSPKLVYKLELALSNRDNSGGASGEFRNAANIILDASVSWNFYKNVSIQFGQGKLPGNRERVISSGNLQFVDRSQLNSRFTLDRDVGFQLKNHNTFGNQFILKQVIALSQGDGRNVTEGHFGGFGYTFRLEALPFGKFQSKGDYVGSAIKRETAPKLSVGVTYDINKNAVRERGRLGSFIQDESGSYIGKDLNSFFVDLMFKYQGISIMGEYATKGTVLGNANVYSDNDVIIGTYYTGSAINLQTGYMFKNNWEIAARYTSINPDAEVANDETQYTVGLSKFVVGHKLKVQSDITYRDIDLSDDDLILRFQVDFHF